jgi:hypothetical protein
LLGKFGQSSKDVQSVPTRKPTWALFWLSRSKQRQIELICNGAMLISMAKKISVEPTQEEVLEQFAGRRILAATKYKEFRNLDRYNQHVNFMYVVACKYNDQKLREMNLDYYFKGKHGEYLNWLRADLRKTVANYPNAEEKRKIREAELNAELKRLQSLTDVGEELVKQFLSRQTEQPMDLRSELLRWLEKQPPDPDLWHLIANDTLSYANLYLPVYEWIVTQPECDASTAIAIFQYQVPSEYLEVKNDRIRAMLLLIEQKWKRKEYRSEKFSFSQTDCPDSLKQYREDEVKAVQANGSLPYNAPDEFFQSREGVVPQSKWYFSSHWNLKSAIESVQRQLDKLDM